MKTLSLKKNSPRVEEMRTEKPAAPANDPAALRIARRQQVKSYRKHLIETYPATFNYADPMPLAIGISQQLLKIRPDGITKAAVRLTMAEWTKRKPYQDALQPGADRVDLGGKPVGVVTEKQIEYKARKNAQPKTVAVEVDE